ncbi:MULTISPECIES: hypothetical protein [unclassified Microbacterium]|uniref:hypothetical protein n=1 Tax=unclassified Microbacterium TaxID=2609290 RepID=UPI00301B51DA
MAWLDPQNEDDVDLLGVVWPDGASLPEGVLKVYLAVAKSACIAYAPALPEGHTVPDSYRVAQAMQAANVYNAAVAAPGGDLDGGGYGLVAHPLDWQVKQLLRPQSGVGVIL